MKTNPSALHSYPGSLVITGASGGIGYQVTTQFLEAGVRDLVLICRGDGANIRQLCKQYELNHDEVVIQADLTVEKEVEALVEKINKRCSKIWGLLNIAGGSTNGMHWKLSLEEFRKVMDMNLTTTFLMTKALSPSMRNQGAGRIINFSSVTAQTGVAGASHYCAAKSAIEGFTRAVAVELAKKNVLVNAIGLGYFEYGLIKDVPEPMLSSIVQTIPLGRLGKIEDLFPAIEYLLNPAQAYLTGQVLNVSGGQRF